MMPAQALSEPTLKICAASQHLQTHVSCASLALSVQFGVRVDQNLDHWNVYPMLYELYCYY